MFRNPQPYHHLIDLAGFGAGFAMAFHSTGSGDALASGLVMIMAVASFLGNEYGQIEDKKVETATRLKLLQEGKSEFELRQIGAAGLVSKQPAEQKPRMFVDGKPAGFAYNQTLAPVKVDYEREFCKTLVSMKQVSGEMDISETYWLKGKHWQKMDSQLTPSGFIAMRDKFEYWKIVGKKGGASNSPYVVLNEHAIVQRAMGKLDIPTPPNT
jgi:hypothetical protein